MSKYKHQSVNDYEAAIESGDTETAVRIVKEVSHRWGHGTDADSEAEAAELSEAAGITPLKRWW